MGGGKNTQKNYTKKDLKNPDNHDGVITHLEPDILECEVKWALGRIIRNKASGGDGIPVELFQILKDDTVKVLYSICQQIWKTQQWQQDSKRSVFIPILKKGNAKECSSYPTIRLISHASKVVLKILQARLQQYMNHELPDIQAGFGKSRGTRDQIVNICRIIEKATEFRKNIYFCFIDYAKAFDCVDHNKLWKILKDMEIPGPPYLPPEKSVCWSKSNRTRHGTTDWFQIGKGIYQGYIYCHPAYLTYMQSTSCEMPDWMKHKLELRLQGRNFSKLRYANDPTLMAESKEELRSL